MQTPGMQVTQIQQLLNRLNGGGSDDEIFAVRELRDLLGCNLPEYLARHYSASTKYQVRVSCVYYSIRFARCSNTAKQLGLSALEDRSKIVRYRACQLLAISLDKNLLPRMEALRQAIDRRSATDLDAAMDAIANQNQHYFIDRDHSGKMFMHFELHI